MGTKLMDNCVTLGGYSFVLQECYFKSISTKCCS